MSDRTPNRPHLIVPGVPRVVPGYRAPAGGGSKTHPPRDRKAHGAKLDSELRTALAEADRRSTERVARGLTAPLGFTLDIVGDETGALPLESLEDRRKGVELLNVRPETDGKTHATVFVPGDSRDHFLRKVEDYVNEDTRKGKPKNQRLVERVEAVQLARLRELWTGAEEHWPGADQSIAWEVWLRKGDDRQEHVAEFSKAAQEAGLRRVRDLRIAFVDRTVVLFQGTREAMSVAAEPGHIAELRRARPIQRFFRDLAPREQRAWADDLLEGMNAAVTEDEDGEAIVPRVLVLDTGVARGHPLLKASLADSDMHTHDPDWGTADHEGHGTLMAGLALFGDLGEALASPGEVNLRHRLESGKILPPGGENDPSLYGVITSGLVAVAEIETGHARRVACLAVTTDGIDLGRPSAWSAEIDRLCSAFPLVDEGDFVAEVDEDPRLFVISAGNLADLSKYTDYSDSNESASLHDPGQAWNALTIGAYTELVTIDPDAHVVDWKPLAPPGGLSPSSSTSVPWFEDWPIKPEVVMEGGNAAISPAGRADLLDDLSVVTTSIPVAGRLFSMFGDTSAATAAASCLAASIMAQYPKAWPETIRALIIHSARWTPAMRARLAELRAQGLTPKKAVRRLLRTVGFGVPSEPRALWSAFNSLNLISERTIQPYNKTTGSVSTHEMHVHELPWPTESLLELGEVEVKLRVTLSYFVEPSPGDRGWRERHRYASHGLRFEIKKPGETLDQFRARVNKKDRPEGQKASGGGDPRWELGSKLRSLGSIHSDRWGGTAADLATMGSVIVYPVIGWWARYTSQPYWKRRARYSLVVSIEAPEVEVDLYTAVETEIQSRTVIEIDRGQDGRANT